ncbi:MAG: hypothetical protein Q4G02_03730 [bacterium]|nr:hypothetical protein [bacterium]
MAKTRDNLAIGSDWINKRKFSVAETQDNLTMLSIKQLAKRILQLNREERKEFAFILRENEQLTADLAKERKQNERLRRRLCNLHNELLAADYAIEQADKSFDDLSGELHDVFARAQEEALYLLTEHAYN